MLSSMHVPTVTIQVSFRSGTFKMKEIEEIIEAKKELQENTDQVQQVRNDSSNRPHYRRFLSSEIRSIEEHETQDSHVPISDSSFTLILGIRGKLFSVSLVCPSCGCGNPHHSTFVQ